MQNFLGETEQLALVHVLSCLLQVCVAAETSGSTQYGPLLRQVILLLGFFTLLHPSHQGQMAALSPPVLATLSSLPVQWVITDEQYVMGGCIIKLAPCYFM